MAKDTSVDGLHIIGTVAHERVSPLSATHACGVGVAACVRAAVGMTVAFALVAALDELSHEGASLHLCLQPVVLDGLVLGTLGCKGTQLKGVAIAEEDLFSLPALGSRSALHLHIGVALASDVKVSA